MFSWIKTWFTKSVPDANLTGHPIILTPTSNQTIARNLMRMSRLKRAMLESDRPDLAIEYRRLSGALQGAGLENLPEDADSLEEMGRSYLGKF